MIQYELDPYHTTVGFSAKHLGVSTVRGRFDRFEGSFQAATDDFTKARGEAKIEVGSITTNVEQRDNHLRSADFFDAEKFPYIKFSVTRIEKHAENDYQVLGDLTIRDTTKPVVLEAVLDGRTADPFGGRERLGVSLSGQINRMDFGLNWDGLAGAVPLAGHQIKLQIDAEIVAKAVELSKSA